MMRFLEDFIGGWVGGCLGLIAGHPFDTVKVRQQTMSSSLTKATVTTYKYEGFRGFYKGMLFPLLTMGPSNSVFFGVYGNSMRLLQGNSDAERIKVDASNFMEHVFYAGCIAGFVQVVVTCPVEVVKTVLQMNTEQGKGHWKNQYSAPYKGMWGALKGIVRDRGILALYRGFVTMLWRDVPTSGLYTALYEYLLIHSYQDQSKLRRQCFAGGVAGVVSWVVVLPLDVVKSRLQADDPRQPKYKGMIDCFYKTYKIDGPRVFMYGFTATVVRSFPVNVIIFVAYEKTLDVCNYIRTVTK